MVLIGRSYVEFYGIGYMDIVRIEVLLSLNVSELWFEFNNSSFLIIWVKRFRNFGFSVIY